MRRQPRWLRVLRRHVEYGGAHAYERTAFDFAAVQGDVVSHGHVVADDDRCFFIQGVQAGTVLDVDAVADFDVVHCRRVSRR